MNLFRTPFFLPRIYPSLQWRIPTKENELFLTFDDGPVPGPTEFVLDELRKVDAKATFFCIGDNIRKHPSVFEKVINDGHAVGNHTFHHLKGWGTSLEKYVENIELCKLQIANHKTHINNFFRPPYGRITFQQIKTVREKYKIVMWDVLTHDYLKNISRKDVLRGSIRATRPGSIIVFHDSLKAERNLTYVLPKFLEHFSSLGFTFKSLPNV
ncbi:MAG: polysaccharide deacetylase family protein [Bacteroidetes bacterium]|nr:polysaccharide deacetylase family protein [Bacteroidota bacterium]